MKIKLATLTVLLTAVTGSAALAAKTAPQTACDKRVAKVAEAIGESKGTPMIQDWIISQGEKEGQLNFDISLVNDLGFSKTSRVIITVNVPEARVCEIASVNVVF